MISVTQPLIILMTIITAVYIKEILWYLYTFIYIVYKTLITSNSLNIKKK